MLGKLIPHNGGGLILVNSEGVFRTKATRAGRLETCGFRQAAMVRGQQYRGRRKARRGRWLGLLLDSRARQCVWWTIGWISPALHPVRSSALTLSGVASFNFQASRSFPVLSRPLRLLPLLHRFTWFRLDGPFPTRNQTGPANPDKVNGESAEGEPIVHVT